VLITTTWAFDAEMVLAAAAFDAPDPPGALAPVEPPAPDPPPDPAKEALEPADEAPDIC
jgi:hypothetical protein